MDTCASLFNPTSIDNTSRTILSEIIGWFKAENISSSTSNCDVITSHDDVRVFKFEALEKLRSDFQKEAIYSKKEIDDMLEALSELPVYAKNSSKFGKKSSRQA